MEYRRLGGSGLQVSAVGLGTNNFGNRLDEAATRGVIDQALECGVNFIDTADLYAGGESERLIGGILGPRRPGVLVATKFGMAKGELPFQQGASRRWILESVEGSLRRLQTDYIDLYQIHQPDPETPILETLETLDELVRQGKIRYYGHSNFKGWQIADAQWTARSERLVRPVSAQHHCNLLRREVEEEVLPACRAFGLGLIPFFPLASGFLTGKYRDGTTPEGARLAGSQAATRILTPENFQRLERLEAFATERGHTLVELAIGWLLSQTEVGSVIAGASRPEQVRTNVDSSTWRLTAEELAALAKLHLT